MAIHPHKEAIPKVLIHPLKVVIPRQATPLHLNRVSNRLDMAGRDMVNLPVTQAQVAVLVKIPMSKALISPSRASGNPLFERCTGS